MVGINKVIPCNIIRPVKPRNKNQAKKKTTQLNEIPRAKDTVEQENPIKHIDESA